MKPELSNQREGVSDEIWAKLAKIEFVAFDFDGVFTNNKVIVDEDGREAVICNRYDGFGVGMLRSAGIKMAIFSTEKNPVVSRRAEKLRLECYQGLENKAAFLKGFVKEKGIDWGRTAYLGNDINDRECLELAGLSVAPIDAWPEILTVCEIVLKRKGGEGAVREFCELVCRAKNVQEARV